MSIPFFALHTAMTNDNELAQWPFAIQAPFRFYGNDGTKFPKNCQTVGFDFNYCHRVRLFQAQEKPSAFRRRAQRSAFLGRGARTNQGTYFVFRAGSSAVSAYKITATNPPTITPAWSVSQSGQGSPWVTTTDGTNNAIVWVVGSESGGDQRLHGYNGDTGAVVYAGGGANELMTNTRKWNTGIVGRGRIYFAASNKVYAFTVPTGTPTPTPTPTPIPTPRAPTNLTATAVSSSQINLSWTDNSNNETGFVINRTQDPSVLWNYVTTVGANVTSYSNTGLHASTTYFYRVQAINAGGGSAWSNTASARTPSQ
jgi:fibronectin type III domain protein